MRKTDCKSCKWKEIENELIDGWYIIRLDGSKFKPFRVPKIDSKNLKKYYRVVTSIAIKTIEEFDFIEFAYVIDDEFYFLFHSKNLIEEKRTYIILGKIVSYVTARFNLFIKTVKLISRLKIESGEYFYDSRYISIGVNQPSEYIFEIINHGKLFLGNLLVGDGEPFLTKTMDEILSIGEMVIERDNKNFGIYEDYYLLFGRAIFKNGITFDCKEKSFDEYREQLVVLMEEKNISL